MKKNIESMNLTNEELYDVRFKMWTRHISNKIIAQETGLSETYISLILAGVRPMPASVYIALKTRDLI